MVLQMTSVIEGVRLWQKTWKQFDRKRNAGCNEGRSVVIAPVWRILRQECIPMM